MTGPATTPPAGATATGLAGASPPPASAAPATAAQLRALPKAELHCHLVGAVPARTAVDLARRRGAALPTLDPDLLYRYTTLEGFLAVYVAVSRAITTPGDLAEVTRASLVEATRDSGVRYREMAVNPTNHPEMTYRQVLDGVREGILAAREEAGVVARVVVAINREQPPSTAEELVREVLAAPCEEVVGIGLDHNERAAPPAAFAGAYALARDGGLRLTAHAGERGDAAEVAACLDELGVERIDHGYAVLRDPALVRRCRDEGVHFATAWSTQQFHGDDGGAAIGGMLDAGLTVSLSSDDPPMFATTPGEEFVRAGAALGWTLEDARAVARAGLDGAFLSPQDRAALAPAFA